MQDGKARKSSQPTTQQDSTRGKRASSVTDGIPLQYGTPGFQQWTEAKKEQLPDLFTEAFAPNGDGAMPALLKKFDPLRSPSLQSSQWPDDTTPNPKEALITNTVVKRKSSTHKSSSITNRKNSIEQPPNSEKQTVKKKSSSHKETKKSKKIALEKTPKTDTSSKKNHVTETEKKSLPPLVMTPAYRARSASATGPESENKTPKLPPDLIKADSSPMKSSGSNESKSKSTARRASAAGSIDISKILKTTNDVIMRVDCLPYLKKGTPFLKYGRFGYPHFRQIQLSKDNTKILWYSRGKSTKETQISLDSVTEIKFGQQTTNFHRHRAPELEKSSFSLIYENGHKTLDLIAKDPNEYRIWVEGLKSLLRLSKDGDLASVVSLKELIVQLPVRRGRRSSLDFKEHGTGKTADDLLPEAAASSSSSSKKPTFGDDQHSPQKSWSLRVLGDKTLHKEVAQQYQEVKRKFLKRKEELRNVKMLTHPQYNAMSMLLKKVEESVQKVSEWYTNGDYEECDDELWRASVDLESLKNMMLAIQNE